MSRLRSYLVLSDIHLGARSTSAAEIVQHLTVFFNNFSDRSDLADIDVLFIAGDLWDNTVQMSSDTLRLFIPFFTLLLNWCLRNKIKLRILEGTPLHDRGQSGTLVSLHEALSPEVDFKYISTLSIEKMKDLDLNILYVPDECRSSAELVVSDSQQILANEGLAKVDIAIMHGMFKYQLGSIPMSHKVYDEGWFLEHVRYYINIGHIHKPSQYGRILAQGSFDRLKHGEEEAKGAFLIREVSDGEWIHLFIENREAKCYRDISIRGTAEDALNKIDRCVDSLPPGSYIRILGESTHPIFRGFETLKLRHPNYFFSKKTKGKEEVVISTDQAVYKAIALNRDTITQALFKEVCEINDLSKEQRDKLHVLIDSVHEV